MRLYSTAHRIYISEITSSKTTISELMNDLYSQRVMDHYRQPRNRAPVNDLPIQTQRINHHCGDRIALGLSLSGQTIEQIRFDGENCAICCASASMLTVQLSGTSLRQASKLIDRVRNYLKQPNDNNAPPGDLAALQAILKYPSRIQCADLAWQAMAELVQTLPAAHPHE